MPEATDTALSPDEQRRSRRASRPGVIRGLLGGTIGAVAAIVIWVFSVSPEAPLAPFMPLLVGALVGIGVRGTARRVGIGLALLAALIAALGSGLGVIVHNAAHVSRANGFSLFETLRFYFQQPEVLRSLFWGRSPVGIVCVMSAYLGFRLSIRPLWPTRRR